VRNKFAATFYDLAKDDPRLAIVVADISPAGSIQKFREEFPTRFINTGVAEQAMIGIAAGLAMRGLRPFAYTIATFALFRPYEMVRDDLCYQNLAVTVVGIGGGVTYSTLGGTHHAQEDVALACALPNMQVIAPCDPAETALATAWCARDNQGPVYLRLGKAGEPDMTGSADEPWAMGKIRRLRPGTDVAVLSYGPILAMADQVARALADQGRSVGLYSVHTLKPLDCARLADILAHHARVIVIEEMAPSGSLTQMTKALAHDVGARCRIDGFTLDDAFHHVYGSHGDVLAAHGLSVPAILARLQRT